MSAVLLLDDDTLLRSLLAEALQGRGFEVLQAGTVAEADAIAATSTFAVAVVDGLLPDGTGVDFIERLRKRGDDTCVVFLSAFFRDLETLAYLTEELGVAAVCHKPVEPVAFANTVERTVDARRQPKRERGNDDELREKLAALRRDFERALPAKLGKLADALSQAREDAEQLAHARRFAHHLRGSCGSYGFPAVGEAAGQLEDAAVRVIEGAPDADAAWRAVHAAAEELWSAARVAPDALFLGDFGIATREDPILVVDDDPDFLAFVSAAAREAGVEVEATSTPAQALAFASGHELRGAVVDVRLDESDPDAAFKLVKQIRTTEGNEELPVVFASAVGRIEARVAAIEAGGMRFLEKPLTAGQVGEALVELVEAGESRQARILIVDDDHTVTEQYLELLRSRGYTVDALHSAKQIVERLGADLPDVLLLDVGLPHMSGVDVCRALRQATQWELLPILMVTASDDAQTRLDCFRAGASDVITKPVIAEELVVRVESQVERARLVRDRSDRDALSRLMTRRAFIEAFQRSLGRAKRIPEPISLLMLDLDHFKAVNDTYGHLQGDRVIARFGELLRQRFRVGDLRARWGGEEFVIAFPGQGPQFAREAAQRLLNEFCAEEFQTDTASFKVSFTAGVASWPEDGSTLVSLLAMADDRLYRGKRAGRASINLSTFPPKP